MLKQISKLEFIAGGKIYQFLCDQDSPLESVKEALFQFSKLVGTIEDQINAAKEKQKADEEAKAKVESVEEPKAA